jgi:hypothetical protein
MMENRQPLQQMLLGKVVIFLQKTETSSMPITCTSIKSKWIKDLNIRPTTLKLVQEKAGIGKDFLIRAPASQQLRESLDNMKLNSLCTTKEMISKLK